MRLVILISHPLLLLHPIPLHDHLELARPGDPGHPQILIPDEIDQNVEVLQADPEILGFPFPGVQRFQELVGVREVHHDGGEVVEIVKEMEDGGQGSAVPDQGLDGRVVGVVGEVGGQEVQAQVQELGVGDGQVLGLRGDPGVSHRHLWIIIIN